MLREKIDKKGKNKTNKEIEVKLEESEYMDEDETKKLNKI